MSDNNKKKHPCLQCGAEMTTKRENMPYRSLPGAVLVGVEVSRCPGCGEYEVHIPAIDELNRTLAMAVLESKRRLSGGEIRFLRTYLGYSAGDFAKLMGSNPATVSRWESDKQDIGRHADLLLRALVMLGKHVEEYPIDNFAEMATEETPAKSTGPRFSMSPSANSKKWKQTEARA